MIVITTATGQRSSSDHLVWEYDESRPRNLEAEDPRARFAVKRFLGNFPTFEQAKLVADEAIEQ